MTIEERINGRKIGVLGMQRSGTAVAIVAQERGGIPFVSDSGSADSLKERCEELRQHDILFETDGHSDRILNSDYVVISPGVPLHVEIVKKLVAKGVPIFSEIEFASWLYQGRMVAVTGSNGKTTTTTLIGEILTAGGLDAHVCGNIGRPLAEVVMRMTPESVAVVEVSSFQLETIADFKPFVSIILNLTPDHIDRHGSFEAYKQAKFRITENQAEGDVFVLNRDDHESMADNPSSNAAKLTFSIRDKKDSAAYVSEDWLWVKVDGEPRKVIECDRIAIKGPHNLQNAAAAVTVAALCGVSPDAMARALRSFPGVEHRLEKVNTVAGVAFVNDSKATNVDSVCWALRSFDNPVYLIAGGRDKAGDFAPIIELGKGTIKSIIAIGEAREKLFDVLGKAFPIEFADSLENAVQKCFEMAHPGETVLLSPGCASFDMFDNFEHRGRAFKEAVAGLKNGKNSNETIGS